MLIGTRSTIARRFRTLALLVIVVMACVVVLSHADGHDEHGEGMGGAVALCLVVAASVLPLAARGAPWQRRPGRPIAERPSGCIGTTLLAVSPAARAGPPLLQVFRR